MTSEEKNRYKKMGIDDTKEELKIDWLKYVKENSNDDINFIKVKLTAIAMRRLSNAFSCEKIFEFINGFLLPKDLQKEIEENISYFHKSRGEEYYKFKNKKIVRK